MRILVGIGLWFYFFGMRLLAPFHAKARKMVRGRRETGDVQTGNLPLGAKVIWFHAASLGEFEQGRPLIEAWKKQRPADYILLTFFSSSGYEIQKDYAQANCVSYLPFDSSRQLSRFIRRVQPDAVVFIKYDFWPRLIRLLQQQGIPMYLVSASFRPDQPFFKWYGGYFRGLLRNFEHCFVQEQSSVELLKGQGICQVSVAGDTRVDRVLSIVDQDESVPGIADFTHGAFVLVAGSSWEPEERMIHRLLENQKENPKGIVLKIIMAPHDISGEHLSRIEKLFGEQVIRYSRWIAGGAVPNSFRILLVDQIGLLSRLYKYGQVAFVGGGFGRGLHNLLEPAAFGLPVLFGPRFKNFPEASALIRNGGGQSLSSDSELERIVRNYMYDIKSVSTAGAGSLRYVHNSKGATNLVISYLMEKL